MRYLGVKYFHIKYLALFWLLFIISTLPVHAELYTITIKDTAGNPVSGAEIIGNYGVNDLAGRFTGSDGTFQLDTDEIAHSNPNIAVLHEGQQLRFEPAERYLKSCSNRNCFFRAYNDGRPSTVINWNVVNSTGQSISNIPVTVPNAINSCAKNTDLDGYVFFIVEKRVQGCNDQDGDHSNNFYPVVGGDVAGQSCSYTAATGSQTKVCPQKDAVRGALVASCTPRSSVAVSSSTSYRIEVRNQNNLAVPNIQFYGNKGFNTVLSASLTKTNAQGNLIFSTQQLGVSALEQITLVPTGDFQFVPNEQTLTPNSCPGNICRITAVSNRTTSTAQFITVKNGANGVAGATLESPELNKCGSSSRVSDSYGQVLFPVKANSSCNNSDPDLYNNYTSINPYLSGCKVTHSSTNPFQFCPSDTVAYGEYNANCSGNEINLYTISGQIKDQQGMPAAGITILNKGSQAGSSDNNGRYNFVANDSSVELQVQAGQNEVFDPLQLKILELTRNVEGIDFVKVAPLSADPISGPGQTCPIQSHYTVSGTVFDLVGNPLANAEISINHELKANTDQYGNYSIEIENESAAWITPSHSNGLYFDPAAWAIPRVICNKSALNFKETHTPSWYISGLVTYSDGAPMPDADIYYQVGSSLKSTKSDKNGRYLLSILEGKDYLIYAEVPKALVEPIAGYSGEELSENIYSLDFVVNLPSPPPVEPPQTTPTPTVTPTVAPTITPFPSSSPSQSPTTTPTPSATPSRSPSATPTSTPDSQPTSQPTAQPSSAPSTPIASPAPTSPSSYNITGKAQDIIGYKAFEGLKIAAGELGVSYSNSEGNFQFSNISSGTSYTLTASIADKPNCVVLAPNPISGQINSNNKSVIFTVACTEPQASPSTSPSATPTLAPTPAPTQQPTNSPTLQPTPTSTSTPVPTPSLFFNAELVTDNEGTASGDGHGMDMIMREGNLYFSHMHTFGDVRFTEKVNGTWQTQIVSQQAVNFPRPAHAKTAIALIQNKINIFYYHQASGSLRLARRDGVSNNWNSYIIDSGDENSADVGGYPDAIEISSNQIGVCYKDISNGDLRYAYGHNNSWRVQIIDSSSNNVGDYCTIIKGHNEQIYIAYYDSTAKIPKLARKTGNSWITEEIDIDGLQFGVWPAMAQKSDGTIVISAASYKNSDSGESDLVIRQVSRKGNQGPWTLEHGAGPYAGGHSALAFTSTDKLRRSYRNMMYSALFGRTTSLSLEMQGTSENLSNTYFEQSSFCLPTLLHTRLVSTEVDGKEQIFLAYYRSRSAACASTPGKNWEGIVLQSSSYENPADLAPTPGPSSSPSTTPSTEPSTVPTLSEEPGISLNALCSNEPGQSLRWKITNKDEKSYQLSWSIYGSQQSGSLSVARESEIELTTQTITNNPNTMLLFLNSKQIAAQAGNFTKCAVAPTPTTTPTITPTASPSQNPTSTPSATPSAAPSIAPTKPSQSPTTTPSSEPSTKPSVQPTVKPSAEPSSRPSTMPSSSPSIKPSVAPSVTPTLMPTSTPTVKPTSNPTVEPTPEPSPEMAKVSLKGKIYGQNGKALSSTLLKILKRQGSSALKIDIACNTGSESIELEAPFIWTAEVRENSKCTIKLVSEGKLFKVTSKPTIFKLTAVKEIIGLNFAIARQVDRASSSSSSRGQ